jgi:hypothetical protein
MKEFEINLVPSCTSSKFERGTVSWEELKNLFRIVHRKGALTIAEYQEANDDKRKVEKDGWAWIPCSVHDSNGRRNQENMKEASLMVLDIDCGMSLETIMLTLSACEFAVHSSFSHTVEKPKWRVILPMLESIPAKDLGVVFDHFNEMFSGLLDASCGHDPARLYYLPACPADAENLFTFIEHAGEWADAQRILEHRRFASSATSIVAPVAKAASCTVKQDPFVVGVSEGERNDALAKRAGQCFKDGKSMDEAIEKCAAWNNLNDPPLPEKELISTVKSVFKTHARRASTAAHDLDTVIHAMNEKYAWVERYGRIFRFEFLDLVTPESLKNTYANTAIECNVRGVPKLVTHAEAWLRAHQRRHHRDVAFVPGAAETVDECINLWRGWPVAGKAGDTTPWNELLDHLFSGNREHREWFENWLAYPIQHPGAKMNTCVAIWSTRQGVGKSLIGETVGKLYMPHFRTISAQELHAPYNNWAKDVQFVLGEENASADHRADSNKLKHLITGNTIVVNEKYQPSLEMRNVMNFLFTSNHPDAFHLEEHDRRFFVWEIKASRLEDEFYARFVDWRDHNGGLAALMHHFLTLDISTFDPKANAPITEAKREMISHSRTDIERWLNESLDDANVIPTFGKEVIALEDAVAIYQAEGHGRTNRTAMGKALRRITTPAQRRVLTKRGRKNLVSLANHDRWHDADNDLWAREFGKPKPASVSF